MNNQEEINLRSKSVIIAKYRYKDILVAFLGILWIFSAFGYEYIPYYGIIRDLLLIISIVVQFKSLSIKKYLIFYLLFIVVIEFLFYGVSTGLSYTANFIIPIIIGYIINFSSRGSIILIKLLHYSIYLCVGALFYETLTGIHLVQVEEDFLYSGEVFRCGIFSNSKESGLFLGCISLILYRLPKSFIIITIALVGTILTGCRTASVLSLVALIYSLKRSDKIIQYAYICVFSLIIICFFTFIDEFISLDRLQMTFSLLDEGNSSRIEYISKHLSLWSSNLSLMSLLFGFSGYTTKIIGNGMESSCVQILIDGGLFLFFFYYLNIFKAFLSKRNRIILIPLFLSMFICGFGTGFSSGILFWVICIFSINKKEFDKNIYKND